MLNKVLDAVLDTVLNKIGALFTHLCECIIGYYMLFVFVVMVSMPDTAGRPKPFICTTGAVILVSIFVSTIYEINRDKQEQDTYLKLRAKDLEIKALERKIEELQYK